MMEGIYIPIQPRSKAPLVSNWQDPTMTVERAKAEWWKNVPDDVNKALRLDGLLVLDFDTEERYYAFVKLNGSLVVDCPTVKTPRGFHIYFRLPEGEMVSSGPVPGAHIDIKSGRQHYVLVPPSVNVDGVEYRWL